MTLKALGEEDFFSRFDGGNGIVRLSEDKRGLCEKILSDMLFKFNKNGNRPSAYLKASLAELLMILGEEKEASKKDGDTAVSEDLPHSAVSKIIGYINNNYTDDISLSSICSKFYISPCYFSRTFKKVAGLGFAEYLNNVRIKEAKNLLRDTAMSITDIGFSVGYKSTTHFGRVFSKIVGCSPIQYRQRH